MGVRLGKTKKTTNKKKKGMGKRMKVFSEEFLGAVESQLVGGRASREAVAAALGAELEGVSLANLKSLVGLAVACGALPGWESRVGVNGGIVPVGTPTAAALKAAEKAERAEARAAKRAAKAAKKVKAPVSADEPSFDES